MKKLKLLWDSGNYVTATMNFDGEPELASDLWQKMSDPQNPMKGFCGPTLSTGDSYSVWFRPVSTVPETVGTLRAPIGRRRLYYTELQAGNILWTKTRLYVCYGPCTEPGLVGSVVAQVDPECMDLFSNECEEVRNNTFFRHIQSIITLLPVEK